MESHASMLCKGLRRRGHSVTLFAAGGSDDPCLVPLCDRPYQDILPWDLYRGSFELAEYQRHAFSCARSEIRAGGFDVVHNNSLYPDLIGWLREDGVPCVTSHHVPPFAAIRDATVKASDAQHAQFTVTSQDQKRIWSEAGVPSMQVVHNGIDIDFWRPGDQSGEHLCWAGRINPNKGVEDAILAARMANVPLRLFGPVDDAPYFVDRIEPLLNAEIQFFGAVSRERLRDEMASASAVLVTPKWDEPFGLVAAEAMACGTPVLAYDRGALREVVGPGGIVVPDDHSSLARAIATRASVDRDLCRMRAVTHFSVEAMLSGYEELYATAMVGRGLTVAPSAAAFADASSCSSTTVLLA